MIPNKKQGGQSVRIDTRLARVYRMKKGVMTTARLVNDRLKAEKIRWVPVMVTLTYRNADDWQPEQITKFINRVQMYAKRRGYTFPNVWVMELQKRGAPHYHVLFWIPARLRLHRPDSHGWWVYGSTNVTRVRNAVGYVAKYASKFESKDATFPHGARIHGIGGITKLEKRVVAWWKLPKEMRTGEEGSCAWVRNEGGGWRCRDTGEVRTSDWGMSAVGDGTVLLCRKTLDDPQRIGRITRLVEITQAHQWAVDYRRRGRLAVLKETNPAQYWQFFDFAEMGRLRVVTSPDKSFR